MIGAVAFDFDGTLVRSNEIKHESLYAAIEAEGLPREILDAVLAEAPAANRFAIFARVARRVARGGFPAALGSEGELTDRMVQAYSARCERLIADAPEVPGAQASLAALADGGVPLFVVSSTPTPHLVRLIALRGLAPFLRGVFGSPASKVENLHAVIRATALAPSRVAVVGDGEDDRVAARTVGCPFVGLLGGSAERAGPGSDGLPDLAELPTRLGRLGLGSPRRAGRTPGARRARAGPGR